MCPFDSQMVRHFSSKPGLHLCACPQESAGMYRAWQVRRKVDNEIKLTCSDFFSTVWSSGRTLMCASQWLYQCPAKVWLMLRVFKYPIEAGRYEIRFWGLESQELGQATRGDNICLPSPVTYVAFIFWRVDLRSTDSITTIWSTLSQGYRKWWIASYVAGDFPLLRYRCYKSSFAAD